MSGQVFVDETKHRAYLMVAAVLLPADVAPLRRAVRGLVLPGQRRVHMKKESAARRRLIADTIVRSGVTAVIFDAGDTYPSEFDARQACLQGVISYADDAAATRLVLEQDDSLLGLGRPPTLADHRRGGLPRHAALRARPSQRGTASGDPRRRRLLGPKAGSGAIASVRSSPASNSSNQTWAVRTARARLTNRPDGYRAHFPALCAPGKTRIPRGGNAGGRFSTLPI